MARFEIISPSGEVTFRELDLTKGVSNIGRHPENDIVIDSPSIALYHAVLDYRQKPYQIVILADDAEATLGGQRLKPNTPAPLGAWDSLTLAGYSLILFDAPGGAMPAPSGAALAPAVKPSGSPAPDAAKAAGAGASAKAGAAKDAAGAAAAQPAVGAAADKLKGATPPVQIPPVQPPAALGPLAGILGMLPFGKKDGAGTQGAGSGSSGVVAPVLTPPLTVAPLSALPEDKADDAIICEMPVRAWTLNVDQSATAELTVANGGAIVATFEIRIAGLDPSWYVVTPPTVNLNEGQRTTARITMRAPRLPTSSAGDHFFAVSVTSPNYPDRISTRGATLTINPYYEYAVGEPKPREQSLPYRKRHGQVSVPIVNRGNSETHYKLSGEDNEQGCGFAFMLPGESVPHAREGVLTLPSNVLSNIPITVTPFKRSMVGLVNHHYTLTVTTAPQDGQQTARTVMAQLQTRPMFGRLTLMLVLLVCAAFLLYIFLPGIDSFSAVVQVANTPTPAPTAKGLAPFGGYAAPNGTAIAQANATSTPAPKGTPPASAGGVVSKTYSVRFNGTIKLQWVARPFSQLELSGVGSLPQTTGDKELQPGAAKVTYTLKAHNALGDLIPLSPFQREQTIDVEVVDFQPDVTLRIYHPDSSKPWIAGYLGTDVPSVTKGQTLTLSYDIQNVNKTSAIKLVLPTSNSDIQVPDGQTSVSGSLDVVAVNDFDYRIEAANVLGSVSYPTDPKDINVHVVIPDTPTPTATPTLPPPVVRSFLLAPSSVITLGDKVTLSWDVSNATGVVVDGLDNPGQQLPPQYQIDQTPKQTTNYVLHPFNQSVVGQVPPPLQVVVNPPAPTPAPPVIAVFNIVPDTVVRGSPDANQVQISWSIVTSATQVTLQGPDFPLSPVSTSGSVLVAAVSKTGPYIITAYNTQSIPPVIQQHTLTILEPTPTPVPSPTPPPTATPLPPPSITLFQAELVPSSASQPADLVLSAGPAADTTYYNVVAGSTVKISWVASPDTTAATLTKPDGTQSSIGPSGSQNFTVNSASYRFVFTAIGPGGRTTRNINMKVLPQRVPDRPANVNGTIGGVGASSIVTLTWTYAHPEQLIGYRVYRATQPQTNYSYTFAADANEGNLKAVVGQANYSYTDTHGPTCSHSYFVVGVYFDWLANTNKETAPSTPVWYSRPCP